MPRRTWLLLVLVVLTWLPTLTIIVNRHHPWFGGAFAHTADSPATAGAASDWVPFNSPDGIQFPSGAYQVLQSTFVHTDSGTRVEVRWRLRNTGDAPAIPKVQSTRLVSYAHDRYCKARLLVDGRSQLRLELAPAHSDSPVYQTAYYFDADCDPGGDGLEWGAEVYTKKESESGAKDSTLRIPIRPRAIESEP